MGWLTGLGKNQVKMGSSISINHLHVSYSSYFYEVSTGEKPRIR